jgi:photosystem II stability/assembly factor-like uncharacterized protein
MAETLLMIGTSKGLLLARSADRHSWQVSDLQFPMNGVYAVAIDTRGARPRLLASVDSSHWGPAVVHSDDLGATWAEPDEGALSFPKDTDAALTRAWAIVPSASEPDVVWAGTQPSALFRSEDRGEHFSLVRGLWDHPHRKDWNAGFGGQAIHTVLPHPEDSAELLVAMSTGGVYRSADAGASWAPSNTGVSAYFMPDPMPEFGQCVHKVARDATDPQRLYLQNHRGVYRSDDGGGVWTSIADDLPCDFGFAMVAHPHAARTAYSFPIESDGMRLPPDRRCRVFRTQDAGATWQALTDGLPDGTYYGAVLRDAMCTDDADPAGVYFGTRTGEVFASADEGEHWTAVAQHLPDVLCVRAAQV